ncbi:MAG: MBL fold metallo-hydrolase [Ignavibacteria bacterium]|nr:MBL fold metallo-hydrolase [Ignavibacteria bacterium]
MEDLELTKLGFKKFIFNPFSENTYLIWDKDTLESMVIDPGNCTDKEDQEITGFIRRHSLIVKYLVNTHGHIDHILGNKYIKDTYSPKYLIPEKDTSLYENAEQSAAFFRLPFKANPPVDEYIDAYPELNLGNIRIELLFTPGHTPGEYCLYLPSENLLFSGDVLFHESIGRTDLPGGSTPVLRKSIIEKLLVLDESTVVMPGHGDLTTIGHEKEHNPFL